MARRQCAWLENKRLFSSHQRLNGKHLYKNNNNQIRLNKIYSSSGKSLNLFNLYSEFND